MQVILEASKIISFIRREGNMDDRTEWVVWRETVEKIYHFDLENSQIKFYINTGVGDLKSMTSVGDAAQMLNQMTSEHLFETTSLINLFLEIEKEAKQAIAHKRHKALLDKIIASVGESINSKEIDEQVADWTEKQKEDKFSTVIKLPGTLKIVLLDFALRCIHLAICQTGITDDWGEGQSLGLPDGFGFFIVVQVLFIPVIVFAIAFLRDKRIKRKANALFEELHVPLLEIRIAHDPWNYFITFLLLFAGVYVTKVLFEYKLNETWSVALGLGILYLSFLFVLLKHFSKTKPTAAMVLTQVEDIKLKSVKSDLSAEENDEEIVELGVLLKSVNEKMDSYVLEAALFGALAFSGFLQVIASDYFSIEILTKFSKSSMQLGSNVVHFRADGTAELFDYLISKEGLLLIMAYQTLFCSIFFLAVIASRLKFNDLTDGTDRALELARSHNERENYLLDDEKLDPADERVTHVTKMIRKQLSLGNMKMNKIAPIMEYMRFFRSLGITTFFAIIVTSGLFISIQLSLIMLFIAVLSFSYFRLDDILQKIKNINTRIQEIYFIYGTRIHVITWCVIAVAVILRSSHLAGAGVLLVLGFLVLFLHYLTSLFVPEVVDSSKNDIFAGGSDFQKILGKLLKVSLAFFWLGFMFKFQHWPGAGALLIIGAFMMSFYFLYSKKTNQGARWVSATISVSLSLIMIAVIFKIMHWPFASLLRPIAVVGILASAAIGWKFKENLLPVAKRSLMLITVLGLLAQIDYFGYSISTMNFNYTDYSKYVRNRFVEKMVYWPVVDGGYKDAVKRPETDSLRKYIVIHSHRLLKSGDFPQWKLVDEAYDILTLEYGPLLRDSIALREVENWLDAAIKLEATYLRYLLKAITLNRLKDPHPALQAALTAKAYLDVKQDPDEINDLIIDIRHRIRNGYPPD